MTRLDRTSETDSALPTGTVTFLLTDVEGSTTMWQDNPAEAAAAMTRHDELVDELLAVHGGIRPTEQGEGDSLVAVFLRARDALDCAIAIQRSFVAEPWPDGAEVRVRMALHTGEAEVARSNYRGAAVIRCARIRNLAHGGQLVVSETTAQVLGDARADDVELVDLGSYELKGLARPERIFQVSHPDLPSHFPPLASTSSVAVELPVAETVPLPTMFDVARSGPFAGRDGEMAALQEAWATAQTAGPRFVGLAGEPGIGKTRLTAEFATRAHLEGATVLAGRCSEEPLRPFEPFAESLVAYTRSVPTDNLARRLGRLAEPLGALVPGLAGPRDATGNVRGGLGGLESGDERAVLFDAFATLLAEMARHGPVVLVLEDLHWATQPTLLLLRYLLQPAQPVPLLIIGTYRDTELDRMHPLAATLADLTPESRVARITLKGLDEAAITECLHAEHSVDPSVALARMLHDQTDGNPFFVRELIRHVGESGHVGKLPEGVREVIGRRLARLPDSVSQALRAASVVGTSFDLEVLEAIPSAAENADELLDALDLAVHASLLTEDLRGRNVYAFTHALVRQTLYEEMSSARRARVHLQVLEGILAVYGDTDDLLAPLAHHAAEAARAGTCERAVDFALRAAKDARFRHAPEEACEMLTRALQVLELDREPNETWEAQLRLEMVEALVLTGWRMEYERHLERALDLSRRSGDTVTFAKAALFFASVHSVIGREDDTIPGLIEEGLGTLGDNASGLQAELLSHLASYWTVSGGDPVRGEQLAERALDVARSSGDLHSLLTALGSRYATLAGEPTTGERARLFTEAEEVCRALGAHSRQRAVQVWSVRHALELGAADARSRLVDLIGDLGTSGDHLAFGSYWNGLSALLDGDFDAAEQWNENSLSFWADHPNSHSVGLAQLFLLRREQGRIGELEPFAAAMIDSVPGLPAFGAALALARAELGRLDEAQAALDQWAADRFADFEYRLDKAVGLFVLGELMARVARPDGAADLYRLLAPYAGTCPIAGATAACVGSMDRSLGQVAAVLERWDEAEAHFEAALEIELRLESPPLIARTRYWYADMLLARERKGDAARARELLDASEAVATKLGMATLAREASALLGVTRC